MILVVLCFGAFAASAAGQTDSNEDECLTSQMLLRQDDHLRSIAMSSESSMKFLQKMSQMVSPGLGHREVPDCSGLFTPVGDSCLVLALKEKLNWEAARQYCQELGADLVVFKDACQYADILKYIQTVNVGNAAINVWVGGSDEAVEDHWLWVTGELMPQGPPFWGSINNYDAEPGGSRTENCAGLYHKDRYYMHDFKCGISDWYGTTFAPLCQKNPA